MLRQGIKGYPTLKMFPKSNGKTVSIDDRTLSGLTAAVNRFCGTKRTEKGKLSKSAGLIPEMKELVKEFVKNPASVQKSAIDIFKSQEKSSVPNPSLVHYAFFMEKIQKSGTGFILNEISRLTSLIDADNVPAAKSDEFSIRRNILQSFAEAAEIEVPELNNADLVAGDDVVFEEDNQAQDADNDSEELL